MEVGSGLAAANEASELFCPWCGYDLRGTAGGRCSECGKEFDRGTLAVSRIPWEHRKELGWMRAYVWTVGMVIFRPGKVGEGAARPVNLRDAGRFRWVTVGICWVVSAVLAGRWQVGWLNRPRRFSWEPWNDFYTAPWSFVLTVMAGGLWLVMMTEWPLWWFERGGLPVERRRRAVAISLYGCAAMLLLPLLGGLAMVSSVLFPQSWLIVLLAPLAWWVDQMVLLRRLTNAGGIYVATFGTLMPLVGIVMGVAVMLGLHLGVEFVVIVVRSVAG